MCYVCADDSGQPTQPTLDGAEFARRQPRGLLTPRAYMSAVLESGNWSDFGIDNWSADYAEPGYTLDAGEKSLGVLFGNWNSRTRYDRETRQRTVEDDTPKRVSKVAEYAGFNVEWSDEWSTCEDCGKAVRTSADSYGWTRSYVILGECSLLCRECVDEEDYINDYLLNERGHADTFGLDLESYGFTRVNEESFESGWHPGQNDTPDDVVSHLSGDVDYVFQIDDVGQFDLRFSCWTRPKDYDTED